MLDKKNPEDEPRQKRSFIREKVVKQPLTRKQRLFVFSGLVRTNGSYFLPRPSAGKSS